MQILTSAPHKNLQNFMDNLYYTYAYLRKDGSPYYIGKGKGRRAFVLSDRKVTPPKDKTRIIFLKRNLTEEEAKRHEIYMIFVLGRKDKGTGMLRNMTDGGDGISGYVFTEEAKEKIRASAMNRPPVSEEERRRRSERAKGERNPRFGASLTEETKQKISEKGKGRLHTSETKEKMSASQKEAWEKRPRKKTEEQRQRMREGWVKRKAKQNQGG
jgi:hypothetical protein